MWKIRDISAQLPSSPSDHFIVCECTFLSSTSMANKLYSEEMGTYLKLIDSVNGKVAYKKDTENGTFFLFWQNGCGWMVRRFLIII